MTSAPHWPVGQSCSRVRVPATFAIRSSNPPLATATTSAVYLPAAAPLIDEVVLTLAMARDLGLVLGVWAIAWAALTGLGVALMRPLGLDLRHARDVGDGFWLGLAFTILFVQLWHFALPLDGRTTLLLVGLGFAGLAWNQGAIRRACPPRRALPSTLARAAVAVAVVWIALRAIGPSSFYDTGMYHMPIVAWSNEFPVVAGLGNLHTDSPSTRRACSLPRSSTSGLSTAHRFTWPTACSSPPSRSRRCSRSPPRAVAWSRRRATSISSACFRW